MDITNKPCVVELVDHMGTDHSVVQAARVSFGKDRWPNADASDLTLGASDTKLIKYLAKHSHSSPFEHCTATLHIECPLYIRSQVHRHRTFSYNEVSRRYTSENLKYYMPSRDAFRTQAVNNRQASDGTIVGLEADAAERFYRESLFYAVSGYHRLLGLGLSREQARGVLPQCTMTRFYMTGSLWNWVRFLKLRMHEGAQWEVQLLASEIAGILQPLFPVSMEALLAHET